MGILKTEFTKKIKIKSNKILMVFFIFMTVGCMFFKPTLETENFHIDKQYKKVIDTRSTGVIANQKFQKKIDSLKKIADSNVESMAKSAKEQLKDKKSNGYKDILFWQVFNSRINNPLMMVYFLAFIIMMFCTIYTDEVVSGVDNLILSSKNKFKVLNSKLLLGVLIPSIIYIIYLISQFVQLTFKYGTPQNGNLQAFRILQPQTLLDGSISIKNFILIKVGFILFLLITFSLICVLCSFLSKTSLKAISLIAAVFVSFKVIPYMSFLPKKIIYMFGSFNFPDLFLPEFSAKPPYIYQNSFYVSFLGISTSTFNMILAILTILFLITIIAIKASAKRLTAK
ncbi:hypothetical protein [Clostridium oceanicum]|uniref:ABC transporter permease n=1 Tax=Clostridium oceanicum TaxID=1543 RepID=A0ABN1JDB9_9CLOT